MLRREFLKAAAATFAVCLSGIPEAIHEETIEAELKRLGIKWELIDHKFNATIVRVWKDYPDGRTVE